MIDKIPAIFSNLEPSAQSKLAHAYYMFFPSEDLTGITTGIKPTLLSKNRST